MITLNHLVRKKPDIDGQEFSDYWLNEHALQCLQIAKGLGIGKYTKCETLHEDPENQLLQSMYGTATDSYDFVDQMVIGDLENFKNGLADKDLAQALKNLHDTSAEMVDFSRSDYWFSADIAQIYPRQEIVAAHNNSFVKVYYVPRRHEHLSLNEAQLHWNTCHGGIARQFSAILPFDKYIQGHRLDSSVVWQLKSLLNAQFENIDSIVGQAEAWLDRRVVPSLQGPEMETMVRMLLQDIALFVDPGVSHIFATKEHVILDKQVITDPVPCLFTAD